MAKGNGKSRDVQEQILEELKTLNGRIESLTDRVGTLREDLTMRLDRVIENTGAHWRDLERRVSALEQGQRR